MLLLALGGLGLLAGGATLGLLHATTGEGEKPRVQQVAGAVATRHARANAVTASLDRLDFYYPLFIGDLVTLSASLNYVGKTSMEVGIRVESENLLTGDKRHIASAYMTFVALDRNNRPTPLPPLILEADDEIRRNQEAKARRERRLAEKTKEKQCQLDPNKCDFS